MRRPFGKKGRSFRERVRGAGLCKLSRGEGRGDDEQGGVSVQRSVDAVQVLLRHSGRRP